jgi:hypothetical protein
MRLSIEHASPAPLPACGLQKYDSLIVRFLDDRVLPISGTRESGEVPSGTNASRLTADYQSRPPLRPLYALTRRFAQNYMEIAGLGYHRVNLRLPVFDLKIYRAPRVAHALSWSVAPMTDLTVNGGLFIGPACLQARRSFGDRRGSSRPAGIQTSVDFMLRFARRKELACR